MPRAVLLPLIVACALFMETLDGTVLSTALPTIAADFGESPIVLKLALTSYMLAMAAGLPASGWLADRFGARTVFQLALATFTLGSIACGLSSSVGEIVAARSFQGLGGAMMVPVGRLVILRSVPKHELLGAMAWLTLPALFGPILGPLVGGAIVTYLDWRWIFWINIPVGLLGIVLAAFHMDNHRAEQRRPADIVGLLLLSIGMLAFLSGVSNFATGQLPDHVVWALVATGAAMQALYVLHWRRRSTAAVDLGIFAARNFSITIAGVTLFRLGVGALPFLMPLLLQISLGMSPLNAGVMMMGFFVGAAVMKASAAGILRRFGYRAVLIVNGLLAALFIGLPGTFSTGTAALFIVAVLMAGGFFRSLQFTAVNTLLYADIAPGQTSSATTVAAMVQQAGLVMAVTLGAFVLGISATDATLHEPGVFFAPFLVAGLVTATSAVVFTILERGAGQGLSKRE